MIFLVIKSNIEGIGVNTTVEFRDAFFFKELFSINGGIPLSVSNNYSTRTSSSIPDNVKKVTNMEVDEPTGSFIIMR